MVDTVSESEVAMEGCLLVRRVPRCPSRELMEYLLFIGLGGEVGCALPLDGLSGVSAFNAEGEISRECRSGGILNAGGLWGSAMNLG